MLDINKSKKDRIALGIEKLYLLQEKYESSEIEQARKNLTERYNEHKKDWVSYYFKLSCEKVKENRRVLSHFYQQLAHLYEKRILTKKILFPSWWWSDLDLLGEAVLPIEKRLREPSKTAIKNLESLYNDFREWKKKDKYKEEGKTCESETQN